MSAFDGLPPGLFEFFAELQADNSKAFWQTNKHRYEHEVREPMRALLTDLSEEFGPLRMFRPNRDVRFSADKSPYKLWTGATSEAQAVGGIGYYLEASAKGIVTGYGAMLMTPDQLRRFRAAIDDGRSGPEFEQLVNALVTRSLPVTYGAEEPLKTAPRGYSTEHPRIHYLRWKGAAAVQEWPQADWMHTVDVRSRRHFCPKSSTLVCVSRTRGRAPVSYPIDFSVVERRGLERVPLSARKGSRRLALYAAVQALPRTKRRSDSDQWLGAVLGSRTMTSADAM